MDEAQWHTEMLRRETICTEGDYWRAKLAKLEEEHATQVAIAEQQRRIADALEVIRDEVSYFKAAWILSNA